MDDGVQNGPTRPDQQWLPTFEKGEKRAGSLGSGALRFIRPRSSIRRGLERQCHRSKTGESYGARDHSHTNGNGGSGGGGIIGKWLREYLGSGSKGGHDGAFAANKGSANNGDNHGGNGKSLGKTIYTSQNLYCSLPREHGARYAANGRKINHGGGGGSAKPQQQGYDRPRSNSVNHREKPVSCGDLGGLTRGGPIYGSEGRSLKKRNRDRRRHSLHETHDQGRHRRRSREAMIGKLKELVAEQTELRRRNKLLEQWIVRHTKKMQEKATPTDTTTTTTTTARDPEEMERIYRQTLCAYKLRLDEVTERRARTTADLQSHEDRACELRDETARTFDELLEREREVATGLVYATTGRKIAGKAVDEITRRQVSRREALARDRYGCIVLQYRLEKACARLRDLETLGEGRTAMDYEALRTAHASHRDKLDERDRELEKLRHKIAETVNGLAHHKEKEACLAEDIALEQRELDVRRGEAVRVREDVNRLHLILRDLRRAHDERRLGAGLLMAQPVLREMERTMKSLDALRNDIEIIKREIQRYGPAYGKGRGKDAQRGEASSTMTQDKPGRS